jgi:hypothetical protein
MLSGRTAVLPQFLSELKKAPHIQKQLLGTRLLLRLALLTLPQRHPHLGIPRQWLELRRMNPPPVLPLLTLPLRPLPRHRSR